MLGEVLSGLSGLSLDVAYPRNAEWFKAQFRELVGIYLPLFLCLSLELDRTTELSALPSICSGTHPFQPYFSHISDFNLPPLRKV